MGRVVGTTVTAKAWCTRELYWASLPLPQAPKETEADNPKQDRGICTVDLLKDEHTAQLLHAGYDHGTSGPRDAACP